MIEMGCLRPRPTNRRRDNRASDSRLAGVLSGRHWSCSALSYQCQRLSIRSGRVIGDLPATPIHGLSLAMRYCDQVDCRFHQSIHDDVWKFGEHNSAIFIHNDRISVRGSAGTPNRGSDLPVEPFAKGIALSGVGPCGFEQFDSCLRVKLNASFHSRSGPVQRRRLPMGPS